VFPEKWCALCMQYRYTFYSGTMNSTSIIQPVFHIILVTILFWRWIRQYRNFHYKVVIADLNGCKIQLLLPSEPCPCLPGNSILRSGYVQAGYHAWCRNNQWQCFYWRWFKSLPLPLFLILFTRISPRNDSAIYAVKKVDQFGCIQWDTTNFFVNNVVPVTAGQTGPSVSMIPLSLFMGRNLCFIDTYAWWEQGNEPLFYPMLIPLLCLRLLPGLMWWGWYHLRRGELYQYRYHDHYR